MKRWIKKEIIFFFLALIIFVILLATKTFFYLDLGDEQENIVAGWLVKNGEVPYRDFFFHHTPLPFFISALIQLLPIKSFLIYRYFVLFFYIAVFGFLYKSIRKKYRSSLYLTFFLIILFPKTLNTQAFLADNFAAVSILSIFLLFLTYSRDKILSFKKLVFSLAIFSFICLWSSYTSVLALGVICVYFGIKTRKKLWRDFLKSDKRIFLIFLINLIFPIYFVINGAFSDFFWANIIYNQKYYFPHRLAENEMELKYGVFYRVFNQFFKYISRESGLIFEAILTFLKTIKTAILNIFNWDLFSNSIKLGFRFLLEKISFLETLSFLSIVLLAFKKTKKEKFNMIFLVLFLIFLRTRTNEAFHINPFYFVCFWGISFLTIESFWHKRKFFMISSLVILSLYFSIGMKEFWQVKKGRRNFIAPRVLLISEEINNLKGYGNNFMNIGGDTILYLLTDTSHASKYFYYYQWFHPADKIRLDIENKIRNKNPDYIYLADYERKGDPDYYVKDLLPIIEEGYFYYKNDIFIRK